MLFFVSFHTRRALRVTPPQQARDTREVGLPAFSSLGAKGSHQLPLSSLKAGKKSVNSQTQSSNCLGRTQTVLEKLQLGRGQPGRRPPPSPLALCRTVTRTGPQPVTWGPFSFALLSSHPLSRCEEPTLNWEPPSWSGFPLRHARAPHQGSAILLPLHAPCPTAPTLQHQHQDMGLHRRGGSYGKNSPNLHLPQKCPLVCLSLPVHSYSRSPRLVHAGGQQMCSVKGQAVNILASASPVVPAATGRTCTCESSHRQLGTEQHGCVPAQPHRGHRHLSFI